MGSERFSGQIQLMTQANRLMPHKLEAGYFCKFSLLMLGEACRASISARKKKSTRKTVWEVLEEVLNMLLAGAWLETL